MEFPGTRRPGDTATPPNSMGIGRLSPSDGWTRRVPQHEAVEASLGYLASDVTDPAIHMYERTNGQPQDNNAYQRQRVAIRDDRWVTSPPRIDREGFELWHAPTATNLEDLDDDEAVRRLYYPEAARLACLVTGADAGYVFDHQVRRREPGRPALTFGRHGDGANPAAVGRVHNDYSEASGAARVARVCAVAGLDKGFHAYAIVNLWRSTGGPVVDTPLAVCDARTVSVSDLVPATIHYPERSGEIYLVRHSPCHRWHYYSRMDLDDVLVFKQYDTRVSGPARFTPHAAFDLPDTPPDAPLRQSIEVRCLIAYRQPQQRMAE